MNAFYFSLITGLWAAWIAYWLLAAGNAKPNLRRESVLSRLSHPIPLTIALGQWRGLLAVALVIVAFRRKIAIEERWMLEIF